MSRFHPQGFVQPDIQGTLIQSTPTESAHTQLTTYFAEPSIRQPPLQPRPQKSTPIAGLSYRKARRAS